jgi:hypothetical protein
MAIGNAADVWLATQAIAKIEAQRHVSRGGASIALNEDFSGMIK